jgi:hypothetical protein
VRFVQQSGKTYRVGCRDGWLVVSWHVDGRFFPAVPVLELAVEDAGDDLVVSMVETGVVDLASLVASLKGEGNEN